MASLLGKVIALTGGASGIGLATSRLLASRGAILSIADTNRQGLDAALKSLSGDKHIISVVDVRDSSKVNSWIQTTVEKLGKLDGAANIAGVLRKPVPLASETDDDWNFIMDVNAKGIFNCLRAELNSIKDGGSIVNTTSVAGIKALPGIGIYGASKRAVVGLTKVAAKESGDRNVRVNCIAPGLIATNMLEELESSGAKMDTSVQVFDRQANPTEVANLIAFLLSDESSFITGATYPVDGGWTA